MSNTFISRVLTGFLVGFCVILAVGYGAPGYVALSLIVQMVGLYEYFHMFSQQGIACYIRWGLGTGLLLQLGFVGRGLGLLPSGAGMAYIVWCYVPFMGMLLEKASVQTWLGLGVTYMGLIQVCVPLVMLHTVAFWQGVYTPNIVLGIFMLIWASDTVAYLVGRRIGKHKLWVRISPNKTWEGALGGLLATLMLGYLLDIFLPVPVHFATHWKALACCIGILSPLGDLMVSQLKRSLGSKDSGSLLPGHGGILDRFDSLLGALPWVVCWLHVSSWF